MIEYHVKVCPVCVEKYATDHAGSLYCSKACRELNRRRRALMKYSRTFRMQNWPELEEIIEPEKAFFGNITHVIERFSDDDESKELQE